MFEMLTRAQYSTPKNPDFPLIIFREGEPINKLVNVAEREKEQFLSIMKSTTKERPSLSKKKRNISTQGHNGTIAIPGVKLVENPAVFSCASEINGHIRSRRRRNQSHSHSSHSDDGDSDSDTGIISISNRLVADCTGCGKTHAFRPKKYFQHKIHDVYCGQYKDNVRTENTGTSRVVVDKKSTSKSVPMQTRRAASLNVKKEALLPFPRNLSASLKPLL